MQKRASHGSLLVIFLTVFIDLLGFGIVLPLLPIYAARFEIDESGLLLGLLMASFSVMQFLVAPLWGRLSDRIGRRPVLMVGLVGSVVFYTLFGIAAVYESLALLFVSRIGAGVAGATISTAHAYIADTTTPAKRAKGMALIGMAFGMGFTFGPLLGYLALWGVAPGSPPAPWPGYAAATMSLVALLLAIFILPESRTPDSQSAVRKRFDPRALREAFATPSIGLILLTMFLVVFSFANLETTLALMLKGVEGVNSPFRLSDRQILLMFAYIGVVLAVVQGGLVRPLAGRVHEAALAAGGAAMQVLGFIWIIFLLRQDTVPPYAVYAVLALCTTGFAFITPSLNSLLSRRTNPEDQGAVLGLGQSINSLARIVGSGLGIPLLMASVTLPYYVAAILMSLGLTCVLIAARSGKDFKVGGEEAAT